MHKIGSKSEYVYVRPISIVSICSKVFEVESNRQIPTYFEYNSLFSGCQYGWRQNCSTVEAVVSFALRCSKRLEAYLSVGGILYDYKKAFDTVAHNILMQKLAYYGFLDSSFALMKSYL